jgi:hypothetical protein
MGLTVCCVLSEMGLEEELDNAPNVQKKPQLASTGTQCSESCRAVQSVTSNLMQIARPNQGVPAAGRNF